MARLADMLDDSQAVCIVTATAYLPLVRQLPLHAQLIIDVDRIEPQCSVEDLHLKITPDALACPLYTSGYATIPMSGALNEHFQ